MRKCENISPYMRRPLVIYDFATALFWISSYMRIILFYFLSVKWEDTRSGHSARSGAKFVSFVPSSWGLYRSTNLSLSFPTHPYNKWQIDQYKQLSLLIIFAAFSSAFQTKNIARSQQCIFSHSIQNSAHLKTCPYQKLFSKIAIYLFLRLLYTQKSF